MKLICENSNCKKEIEIDEKIICSHCKTLQKKTLAIKPLVAGAILAGFAAFAGYKVSPIVTSSSDNWRYPVKTEFSIIDSCINSDKSIQLRIHLKQKKEICITATEQTMQQISYANFKENQSKFTNAFRQNIKKLQ